MQLRILVSALKDWRNALYLTPESEKVWSIPSKKSSNRMWRYFTYAEGHVTKMRSANKINRNRKAL